MERHFGLAKQWRGIATRYEKLAIRLRALGRALPLRKNRHLSLRLTAEPDIGGRGVTECLTKLLLNETIDISHPL